MCKSRRNIAPVEAEYGMIYTNQPLEEFVWQDTQKVTETLTHTTECINKPIVHSSPQRTKSLGVNSDTISVRSVSHLILL